jgi:hypothetical protein
VSSGLIYAVIVVLWAVVLVPMWLRRHDEATETRSIDRFQGAMHILSRKPGSAGSAVDPGEPAGDARDVAVPARARTKATPDGAAAAPASPAAIAARRRMRVVAILLALTALVLLVSVMHRAPMWAALVPLVVLVGYLLQVRHSIQSARARDHAERRARAAEMRAQRMVGAVERQSRGDVGAVYASEVAAELFDAEAPARPVAPAAVAPAMAPAGAAPAAVAPGAASSAVADAQAGGFYDAVADDAWQPVPVPVPTYVSAPKAPREVRVIDLTRPGAWTSGRLDDVDPGPAVQPAEPEADRDPIVTGELLIERRQAVGD